MNTFFFFLRTNENINFFNEIIFTRLKIIVYSKYKETINIKLIIDLYFLIFDSLKLYRKPFFLHKTKNCYTLSI